MSTRTIAASSEIAFPARIERAGMPVPLRFAGFFTAHISNAKYPAGVRACGEKLPRLVRAVRH